MDTYGNSRLPYGAGDTLADAWLIEPSKSALTFEYFGTQNLAGPTIKVWDGTAWNAKPVKLWDGTAWVTKPIKRWNGTSWVNI